MTTQNKVMKTKKVSPAQVLRDFFEKPTAKQKLQELLGKNAATFATSVLQIANSNAMLINVEPKSIFNAACMAATLNLPIQNGLGFAYILPFKNSKTNTTEAQFQIGYKGFIQLAQRSGQFKRLVAVPVYQKQLVKKDFINGFEFDWEQEPKDGELPIGYYAYFRLLNDFSAELYMSHEEVKKHALRYSQSYKKHYGVWVDNFEAMALKTVLKLLLSKQAPLSVEMQSAVLADQSIVKDSGEFAYPDNEVQEAEYSIMTVSDDVFAQCKQNILNRETTLQDLCDNGFEFSPEQYAELEKLENQNVSNES